MKTTREEITKAIGTMYQFLDTTEHSREIEKAMFIIEDSVNKYIKYLDKSKEKTMRYRIRQQWTLCV